MAALPVQGSRKHATETSTSREASSSSSSEASLTWCLSQLSKPGLVATEDQRKGTTGQDTAGAREADNKTRTGQWQALVAIRTQHIKAGSSGIGQFRAKGGLAPLLNLIKEPQCSRKTLDLALSILANCCTERETRVEVRKHGGISVVVDILKRNVAMETVQNRAARALGNLAMDPESSTLIHSAGGVPLLLLCVSLSSAPTSPLAAPSKAPCPKMECAQSAARALLYLADTPANRLLLLTQGTLTALAPLIAPEYPLGLRRAALRTLHELTRGCGVECAREVSRSGVLAQLGVMASGEAGKPFEEHSLKTLANLCSQGCLRPLVGSLGVIQKFTEEVKKDPLKSGVFLKALCLCCKEAVNRAKVKESSGLEVLIGFLGAHRSHPLSRLAILACVDFVYDESALEQLQELGLVPLLVARLVELAKGEELCAAKMDVSLASAMSASELLSSSCFDSFDFPPPEGNRKEEVGKDQGLGSSSFLSLRSWLVSEGLISSEGDLLDTPGGVEGDWGSLQIPSSSPLTPTPDSHSPSKCSSPPRSVPSSTPKPGTLVQPAFSTSVSPVCQLHLPSPCKDAGLSASTPHPSSTSRPHPSSDSTPQPSSDSTPQPTSASTPQSSAASTPQPSAASTPHPSSDSTPHPSSASTPHPSSDSTPHPLSASTPQPSSASTPHPSSASTPHPLSASTSHPSPTSLSSPSKAPHTPLSASKFSSPPRKRPRVHSAARSSLVPLDAPPSVSRPLVFHHPYHPEPWAPESPVLLLLSRFSHATDPSSALVNLGVMSGLLFYLTQHQDPSGRCFRMLCRLSCNPNCLQALVRTGSVALIRHHLCQGEGGKDRAERQTDRVRGKVKQLGLTLLSNLRIQCESGFGSGVLSHVMLSGSESDKLNCALSLPLINSNKALLKKLLLDSGGLLLALEPLGCPEDHEDREDHASEHRRFPSDWLNSPQQVSAPQLHSLYFSLLIGCLSSLISSPKAEPNKRRPGAPAPNTTPPASETGGNSPPPLKKPRLANRCPYADSSFDLLFLLDDGTLASANREALAGAAGTAAVGSEYFRALLMGGFGEARSGAADAIPIRDVSGGTLLPVLHYLHGCRLSKGPDNAEDQEADTGRGHCKVLGSLADDALCMLGEGAWERPAETRGFQKTPLAEMMIGACRFLVDELQREAEDLCVSLILSWSSKPAGRVAPTGKNSASNADQCGSGGESADESLANRASGLELSGSDARDEPGAPGKDKRQPTSGPRPKIKSLPNTTSDMETISGVSPIPKPSCVSKISKGSHPKGPRLTSKTSVGNLRYASVSAQDSSSSSSSSSSSWALAAILPQVYWFSQRYSYRRLGRACLSSLLGSPQTFPSSSSAGDCLRRLAREADCTETLRQDLVHLTTMALS